MNVGKRIKEERDKLGLSVDEVADALGKNRSTIYRYESNEIEKMPINILEPLAKVLKISPAYLMGWTDEKHPDLTSKTEPPILTKYNKLNNKGKEKTDSYVDDLLESPKYVANQKYIVYGEENKSYPAVAAPDITPARANPKKKQIKHSNW